MTATVIAPSSLSLRIVATGALVECDRAAARLYDAEVALHAANQSHVEAWITAAYRKLHVAVEAHTMAAAHLAAAHLAAGAVAA